MPSIELEGFGLVNLESLAMGVPVLATPQGGMKDLKSMFENFYLCDDLNDKSITKAIDEIYDKVKGIVIYEEKIQDYSWENISNKIIDYINNCITT